jgi:hypothetical protein
MYEKRKRKTDIDRERERERERDVQLCGMYLIEKMKLIYYFVGWEYKISI